jgi:hypothetical protein
MVQRNLTPGGDKNGADITMALDALEMAFTHDHINAFVIVGGDSDFISLVEKLKQYDRKVIVVGGRQFTSVTMQRNCHEFIAYENLMGSSRGRSVERGARPAATSSIAQALPLVKRALKVLSDREVTPQLGLLKSTLLQLDSTFSERDYGASTFRDFMEKVAEAGAVTLRQAGRSLLVETRESGAPIEQPADVAARVATQPVASMRQAASVRQAPPEAAESEDEETEIHTSPMSMADGVRAVQHAVTRGNPRWPMYVRQARQYLKNSIEGFDERRYGFASVVDLLRACAKEGVLRVERDRQGGMRVFPGANLKQAVPPAVEEVDAAAEAPVEAVPAVIEPEVEVAAEPPIIDAEPIEPPVETVTVEEPPRRGGRKRKAASGSSKRKAPKNATAKPRARRGRSKSDAAEKATQIA